jgi:hypothetical protein
MATNVYVDLLKEIVSRLSTATGAGKKLAEIENFQVGKRASVKEQVKKPAMTLYTPDGDFLVENYVGLGGQYKKSAEVTMLIELLYAIPDTTVTNLYYDSATPPAGILPLIEKTLDVISETVAQVLDPQMNQNSRKAVKLTVDGITKLSDATLRAVIILGFDMNDFSINGRNVV